MAASVDSLLQDSNAIALPGLGRAMVAAGKLGQKAAEDIYGKSISHKTSFISELVGSGIVSASDLAHTLSQAFAAPLVNLDAIDPQRLPRGLLDNKTCQDYRLVVLSKRNNRLMVATADPSDQRAAEKIRPEGAGTPSADHVGFGTLLFTQVASGAEAKVPSVPAPPGGMIGKASGKEIKLTWIAAVSAKHYTVKRAAGETGSQMIAKNIAATSYTDTATEVGKVYRYVVSASNAAGDSADSHPSSISAGLAAGWEHQDIGPVAVKGSANYDGTRFTIEGAGTEIGGASDQGHFASHALDGDGYIIARFVPQTSSQVSKFGLTLRDGCKPEAAHVSLLVGFELGTTDEQRAWKVRHRAKIK